MNVPTPRILVPSLLLAPLLTLLGFVAVDDHEEVGRATTLKTAVTPFLMFETGDAEEAMNFYVEVFGGRVLKDVRYGADDTGPEGLVFKGVIEIGGQVVRCTDATIDHGFTFTPSTSFFVDCPDETELERLVAALSEGGELLMPPGDYGFSQKFAWAQDRFGVSWQLNLPNEGEEAF